VQRSAECVVTECTLKTVTDSSVVNIKCNWAVHKN